jgi:hypothetical protein
MSKYIYYVFITILYILFGYMVLQGFRLINGHVLLHELYEQQLFKIIRATFFILALSMTFVCLIKFLYQVNKKNFIRLLITSFPIGIALIYIIYGSMVFFS